MLEIVKQVFALVVALGILVTIHEFGHYWVARRLGIRVLRFSVGFGKPLKSWWGKDGTEYCVAGIPLGGYVKLLDARESDVAEQDMSSEFSSRPVWQRLAVYFAGPLINLLFALMAYWFIFSLGVATLIPRVDIPQSSLWVEQLSTTVAVGSEFSKSPSSRSVSEELSESDDFYEIVSIDGKPTVSWEAVTFALVARMGDTGQIQFGLQPPSGRGTFSASIPINRFMSDASQDQSPVDYLKLIPFFPKIPAVIGGILAGGAAEKSGLLAADKVVSANGQPVRGWGHWVDIIQSHPGKPVALEVKRDGEPEVLRFEVVPEPFTTEEGKLVGRVGAKSATNNQANVVTEGGVGLSLYRQQNFSPVEALVRSYRKTCQQISLTLSTLMKMVVGKVSVENLSGPITIAKVAADSAAYGWEPFLSFMAYLSISLGVLNLLPIPVLDGGHILLGVIEGIRGKPLSDKVQEIFLSIGVIMLGLMMLLAFYNDFVRLLK